MAWTMGTLILKATASQSLQGFGSLGWGLTGASRKSIRSKVRLSWGLGCRPHRSPGPRIPVWLLHPESPLSVAGPQ